MSDEVGEVEEVAFGVLDNDGVGTDFVDSDIEVLFAFFFFYHSLGAFVAEYDIAFTGDGDDPDNADGKLVAFSGGCNADGLFLSWKGSRRLRRDQGRWLFPLDDFGCLLRRRLLTR